jgi:sarcosine oxidase delta subunit
MEDSNPEYVDDLVIGGGGLHGSTVMNKLTEEGRDVVGADPNGFGYEGEDGVFEGEADGIGVDYMRSPMEHHVAGDDDYSLWEYAIGEGRLDEVEDGRPSLELFLDHWKDTVERNDLDEDLYRGKVEEIEREDGLYKAVIDGEEVWAENAVLATGKGPLNYPDYAEELPDEADAYHALGSDFDVEDAASEDKTTYVVGSGETGGKVAKNIEEYGGDVKLLSRSSINVSDLEADEEWQDWDFVRDNLAGSQEERYETVQDERYDGAMSEQVYQRLLDSEIDVSEGVEINDVNYDGEGINIELSNGETDEDVQIIFATGFEDAYQDSFYQEVAEELDLETGYNDMPVLDEETLEWRDEHGTGSNMYVTGELAQGVLGPYAPNIRGAQMASSIILEDLDQWELPQVTASNQSKHGRSATV